MVELKDATLTIDGRTMFEGLSVVAPEGQLTRIGCSTPEARTLLARTLVGFVPLSSGYITIDGELLTPYSVKAFRRLMAYWPDEASRQQKSDAFLPSLKGLEQVWAPVIADAVPEVSLNNGHSASDNEQPEQAQPSAVGAQGAANKQIVIADNPSPALLSELNKLAEEGRVVIITTVDDIENP